MNIDNYFIKHMKAERNNCSNDKFEYISGDKIIFEYRLKNAGPFEICEDEDGLSITIYRSGYMLYREYVCEDIEVSFSKYMLPENIVRNIHNKIMEAGVYDIPEMLDNGSFDGSFNNFVFYDNKKIAVLNIDAIIDYRKQLNRCTSTDKNHDDICNDNMKEDKFDDDCDEEDFDNRDLLKNYMSDDLEWDDDFDKYSSDDELDDIEVEEDEKLEDELPFEDFDDDINIKKVIEYEGILIELFDEISEELRKAGYKLTLHSFEEYK